MIKVTVHYAKTHLSRLLREVEKGKSVVICRGETPVAQMMKVASAATARPKVGEATATGVRWSEDAFLPLSDADLREWGL